jgi:hypothetical protein
MLSKVIESLEEEIVSLKGHTASEIADIDAYLSQTHAKIKLRPRIKMNGGVAFSIIWQRLVFYNWTSRRAMLKAIRKGPSCQVPKSRLLSRCRNCNSWEREYIWEKEQWFAGVRRKVSLLSQGVSTLKQYCAMEPAAAPEGCDCPPVPVSDGACMEMDELVKTLAEAFKSLKERIRQEVAEVISRLTADVRTGLRPTVGAGKGAGFTVEWVRRNGSDPETGLSVERQIPREGKYSMRRSRLLAHCRDFGKEEQEYIWEKEQGFARVRKQVDLLTQAITALKQYAKEEAIEGEQNAGGPIVKAKCRGN